MEAAAISNVPLANLTSAQAGATSASVGPCNAAAPTASEAKQPADFAQVVREIMIRTAAENPTQQVRPLKIGSSSNSKTVALSPLTTSVSNAVPATSPAPSAVNAADVTMLGLLVTPTLATWIGQPQLSTPTAVDSTQSTSINSSAPVKIESPPKQTGHSSIEPASANPKSSQFPSSLLPPAFSTPILSTSFENTVQNVANPQLVPDPQPQQSTNSAQELPAPPQIAAPLPGGGTVSVHTATDAHPALQGEPLSSIAQQVVQLQSPSSNSSVAVFPDRVEARQPSAQPQLAQATMKSTIAAIALTDSKSAPAPLSLSPSIAKLAPPMTETSHVAPSPAAISSVPTNHSDARDTSSNQGGQSASEPASSKVQVCPTQSAPDFSQALSSANNVKADLVSTTPSSAPLILAPTTTSSEHTSTVPTLTAPSTAPTQTSLNFANSDPPNTRTVNDAQLVQAAGHSEMRIAMQTDKLGAIELHARVTGDEVGAAITVEKRDAHTALSIELPTLQQALSEKQLRVDQIALMQGSLSSTAGGASAYTQQGEHGTSQRPQLNNFASRLGGPNTATRLFTTTEQVGAFDSRGRLSVHA